jgi:Concanavalin A-like lectin/glucanases superfamily
MLLFLDFSVVHFVCPLNYCQISLLSSNRRYQAMRRVLSCLIGGVFLWGSLSGIAWADLKDGLVGYWNFDEKSGLVAHSLVPASADGQLFNFPNDNSQWVPGQIGGALYFRGQFYQDYVIVPSYPIATTAVSFSGWVNADDNATPSQSIFKNWGESVGQFQLGLNGTSMRLAISVGQANGASNGSGDAIGEGTVVDYFSLNQNLSFPTGEWVHVGFVADPTLDGAIAFVKLYVNGQQVGIGPYDGTLNNTPPMKSIGIGVKTDDSGTGVANEPGYWWGSFDDFGLWTRALSDDEMAQIYALGMSGKSFYQP